MQRIYLDYARHACPAEVLEAMVPISVASSAMLLGSTIGLGRRGKPSTRQGIRWRRYLAL